MDSVSSSPEDWDANQKSLWHDRVWACISLRFSLWYVFPSVFFWWPCGGVFTDPSPYPCSNVDEHWNPKYHTVCCEPVTALMVRLKVKLLTTRVLKKKKKEKKWSGFMSLALNRSILLGHWTFLKRFTYYPPSRVSAQNTPQGLVMSMTLNCDRHWSRDLPFLIYNTSGAKILVVSSFFFIFFDRTINLSQG